MPKLVEYQKELQPIIEGFCKRCFEALGWIYEPEGRHADLVHIEETYVRHGGFWCLLEDEELVGIVAVKPAPGHPEAAELKRLYVSEDHQGKGYGRLLFEKAYSFAVDAGYRKLCTDSRRDREAALHLLKTHGFREIPRYNDNHFAELFFEKSV